MIALALLAASAGAMAKTKVTFLGFAPPAQYGYGFRVLIDEFNAMQDEVEVELLGSSSSPSTLLPLHAGGLTPDLIYDHLTEQYLLHGILAPFDEYFQRSGIADWIPGTLDWHTFDGHIYGIPYGLLGQRMVFYDRDRMSETGLVEPQEGWTWEDLEIRVRRLSRDTDGDGHNDIFGFDMRPAWFFWPFLINNGTVLYDGERWFPDAERTIEAVEFLAMLAREELMIRESDGGGDGFRNFHERRVATYAASSRDTQRFRDDPPPFDIGVVHFPMQRSRGIIVTPRAFYLGNTNNRQKQDAAWKFIEWALRPEQQTKFLIHGSLLPSTIAGMRDAQAHMLDNDPLLIPFANEIAGYSYAYPFVANFSNASDYSTQWMYRAIDGLVSPREAALQIIHLSNAAEAEIRRQRQ